MKKSIVFGVCTLLFVLFIGAFTPVSAKNKYNKNIPDDALKFNGHYYYYYNESVTWEEAKEKCEALGGHLVVFTNENEEKAVWDYIEKKDTPAWIGLYNAGAVDVIFGTVEDDWKWVTGEKVKYTNWADKQPDHEGHFIQNTYDMYAAIGKGEDVCNAELAVETKTPTWGDFDNAYSLSKESVKGYVCEWDIYEIKVEVKEISVKKGKKTAITYTIYDKAGNKKVKDATAYLKSSNKKIAKVLKSGRIKGVAAGNATITLKYKGAKAKVKVTVTTKSSKKK